VKETRFLGDQVAAGGVSRVMLSAIARGGMVPPLLPVVRAAAMV
jgi:hypothetical protein